MEERRMAALCSCSIPLLHPSKERERERERESEREAIRGDGERHAVKINYATTAPSAPRFAPLRVVVLGSLLLLRLRIKFK